MAPAAVYGSSLEEPLFCCRNPTTAYWIAQRAIAPEFGLTFNFLRFEGPVILNEPGWWHNVRKSLASGFFGRRLMEALGLEYCVLMLHSPGPTMLGQWHVYSYLRRKDDRLLASPLMKGDDASVHARFLHRLIFLKKDAVHYVYGRKDQAAPGPGED